MRRILFTVFVLFVATTVYGQTTESLTLTTYYPAPFGAYDRMLVVPQDLNLVVCTEGMIGYHDGTAGAITNAGLYFCDSTPQWSLVGAAGGTLWSKTGNVIHPTDFANDSLAVGTDVSSYMFEVQGSGILNVRMFLDTDSGAFRAGSDMSTLWIPANIGAFSFSAGGLSPNASGDSAVAMGDSANASGDDAFAMGEGAQATNTSAFAFGDSAKAENSNAYAIGSSATASGFGSVAIGTSSQASGQYSFSMGSPLAVATGNDSFAMGRYVEAGVDRSMVMGSGTAMLSRLTNNISDSLLVGFNNNPTLFVEDGAVGIGTTTPNAALQIDGAIARQGTQLFGPMHRDTHVNLGVDSSTGDLVIDTEFCTISGGSDNTSNGHASVVAGGTDNTASASYSVVSGGENNIASGSHSWAGGRQARANDAGSFVWADNQAANFNSAGANTFNVRASGGVYLRSIRSIGGAGNDVGVQVDGKLVDQTVSSKRYKKDISDLEVDTSAIYDLRPVSFTWKESEARGFGLIAEEVHESVPELVNYDAEGAPNGVDYKRLSVLLLKELQQHQARIEALEAQLAALEQ